MENDNYPGKEKRKHPRIECRPPDEPTFRTVGYKCKVKNISKGGLKFTHLKKKKLEGWVSGTLDLANGSSIDLEGIVIRTASKDMGLSFIVELSDDVIRSIISNMATPGP
ncbi:MAG: PilZ domain-containing protein [Desulfobacterales bacterium]|nr:PilZ domain-containing protein [Desulfobacterales bacterium]